MYNLGHRTVYPVQMAAEILCEMEGGNCPNLLFSTFGYNKRNVKFNLVSYFWEYITDFSVEFDSSCDWRYEQVCGCQAVWFVINRQCS